MTNYQKDREYLFINWFWIINDKEIKVNTSVGFNRIGFKEKKVIILPFKTLIRNDWAKVLVL